MIDIRPSASPGEAGYYQCRIDLCVSGEEATDLARVLWHHGLVHAEAVIRTGDPAQDAGDLLFECDDCGTTGNEDDAIAAGDQCPHDWCGGTIRYREDT